MEIRYDKPSYNGPNKRLSAEKARQNMHIREVPKNICYLKFIANKF